MSDPSATALANCVASLQTSTSLLSSSISLLDQGTRDYPRIKTAFSLTRHFELISEPTLFHAQSRLAAEIAPEVEHLLRRVEQHLEKMERREKGLMAKVELQEARLHARAPRELGMNRSGTGAGISGAGGSLERQEKLRLLRNKRERLEGTVERLGLQISHKERQLRMKENYGA